jgi:hypothetical protein
MKYISFVGRLHDMLLVCKISIQSIHESNKQNGESTSQGQIGSYWIRAIFENLKQY